MPGILLSPSARSVGAIAGMKRAHAEDAVPTYGEPHPKKRKVLHRLHYTQPVQHIAEPVSTELDSFGAGKDFFDEQLRRAIAIQCRGVGFESARPEALEEFRGLVDSFMNKFLSDVRKSMHSSRRTETASHDWVYALGSSGLRGSGILNQHFDTGDIPPSLLQPHFEPPAPAEAPPPSTESLLGPELSGRADKDSRPYIPKNFPPFPSKHTYKSTPVYTKRENDPRKIREKATEEGILAEQSLRKLMAAQKAGIQKLNVGKKKRSARMKTSDKLWEAAMIDVLEDEKKLEKDEEERQAREDEEDDEMDRPPRRRQPVIERKAGLLEGVIVNYDQQFWRASGRGV